MKKIRIFFDISVILKGQMDNITRTGVYFCSYNILEKLRNHRDIKIYLYSPDYNELLLSISKKINVLKGLKYINIQDTLNYKKNIDFHLNSITNSNKILFMLVTLLKIIKNVLKFINLNREINYIDIYFSPYYSIPEIIKNYNIKTFMVLYDVTPLLFPEYFSEVVSNSWKNDMIKHLDKNAYYFCISEYTKYDFLKYFEHNLDKNKMVVTYLSSANNFEPKYDQQAIKYIENKYNINIGENKYIFSFCSLEHRKNLIFTVKCFIKFIQKNNINDLYFLLGGVQWDNFIVKFNATLCELPESYRSKIMRLGYVDDADVNMLYSNSLFFTYVSQYEGFGMPLLEAMQAGTPVIASNNSSLPEVVGDAAITIDYDDEEACISAMENLYFNEDIRQSYIKKGFERAKLFSWDKTANLMVNKIKEVVRQNNKI
jgi:glycosyltransferase involved in cell wall biosynthesis